jgi:TolB protein
VRPRAGSPGFLCIALLLALAGAAAAERLVVTRAPELFLPGLVSTEASEVKIAFSPDGTRMLWGSTNRPGGPGGWDIWESVRVRGRWSAPRPTPFDSPTNDFDPCFAPDGRGIWFFSNRPGGLGGDDVWFAPFDPATGRYGESVNAGPAVNSAGDEWAPVPNPDGRWLLFASDGRGGKGLHDLFVCERGADGWQAARPLEGVVNSADDDFDAAFLRGGEVLVFTRRAAGEDGARLQASFRRDGRYGAPTQLDSLVNAPGGWNLGPSTDPQNPDRLYVTSHRTGNAAGRLDIYRLSFRVAP